jgi:hypothetical protein
MFVLLSLSEAAATAATAAAEAAEAEASVEATEASSAESLCLVSYYEDRLENIRRHIRHHRKPAPPPAYGLDVDH